MKKVGLVMMLLGGAGYYWCQQQLQALEPVPKGVDVVDSLKYYPAARMETGRYVAMGLLATGLLIFLMPTGRA